MLLRKPGLKYKMLQALAFLGDAGVELLMNEIIVSQRERVWGRKRYSSSHFRRTLRELSTTGFIERTEKDGTTYLKLSPDAHSAIARHIPFPYLQKKKWDGYFRAIAYDFPQEKRYLRDRLRKRIKDWGMGELQYSLYVTPHPLEEVIADYIEAEKLTEYAKLFKNWRKYSLNEGREIAEKVWHISELEENYLKFIEKWKEKIEKGISADDIETLRFDFFSLIRQDPHLPFDLLEEFWPAVEAKSVYLSAEKLIKKIK